MALCEWSRWGTERETLDASSDTRCHVATTSIDQLIDYYRNAPKDPFRTAECGRQRIAPIEKLSAHEG